MQNMAKIKNGISWNGLKKKVLFFKLNERDHLEWMDKLSWKNESKNDQAMWDYDLLECN